MNLSQILSYISLACRAGVALSALFVAINDLSKKKIPNVCVMAIAVLGAVKMVITPIPANYASIYLKDLAMLIVWAVVGAAVLFLVTWLPYRITEKKAIGAGDVKFAMALGWFFGWYEGLCLVLISGLIALLVWLVKTIFSNKKRKKKGIRFGFYLAIGTFLVMVCDYYGLIPSFF